MTFFPILKKIQILKKKTVFFFGRLGFSISLHKQHGEVRLQLNGNSVCNSYFFYFFLLTKNDIIVHYSNFPNLGAYLATFLNLKGPRAPSQIAKKNSQHHGLLPVPGQVLNFAISTSLLYLKID